MFALNSITVTTDVVRNNLFVFSGRIIGYTAE